VPTLGDRCFAFVRDISERHKADESLRQARKLQNRLVADYRL
jgi:hypothetical protein